MILRDSILLIGRQKELKELNESFLSQNLKWFLFLADECEVSKGREGTRYISVFLKDRKST